MTHNNEIYGQLSFISSLVYFKSRLSQAERLVCFKFHAPLHAPLFYFHVTLWGALKISEKSGVEVHLVGMAFVAAVDTPRDLK